MPPPTGKSPLHSKTKSPSPLPLPLLLLRLLLGLRRPLDHLAQELGQHVHVQRVPLRFRQQLQVPVGRQPGTTQPSNSAGPESKDQEKRVSWLSLPGDIVEAAVARMLGRVLQDPALDDLVEVRRRAGAADLLRGNNAASLRVTRSTYMYE